MVDELVRELAMFNYRCAKIAAYTGHSENTGYFLDDARAFAIRAGNEVFREFIESKYLELELKALKTESQFCIARTTDIINDRESDSMTKYIDNPASALAVRKKIAFNLISDAYDLNRLLRSKSSKS